ncbi:MAG: Fic family protein [Candidatus Limnocylindrales bacterium]|jgi:hypothetical protein
MVITKSGRGRPSRRFILEQVDLGCGDLAKTGGLPSPVESAEIWRDIWHEEAHNSTALEGNTLLLRQVKVLLEEKRPTGNKEVSEYLEVMAYGQAAEWVYGQAITPGAWGSDGLLTLTELRHIHELTAGPVWQFFPPEDLDSEESPGSFRRHDIAPFAEGMTPPPFTEVEAHLTDWLARVNAEPPRGVHLIDYLAELHAEYERIHPFRDGNGRTGRLVLNLLLVRRGYPPAIIRKADRIRYLRALRRADQGDPGPLGELLARAVKDSLDRFLLPSLAGPRRLLPLSALATNKRSVLSLRKAAERGRLKAQKDESGRWVSMKQWVADYERIATPGRPRRDAT